MQTKDVNESQQGLVVSYFGNQVAIQTDDGREVVCFLRRNQALPIVGDHVHFIKETEEAGVVVDILTRRSLFGKGDARGQIKGMAANVDLVVIVMSPPPVLQEYLIDRYLFAAHLLKIEPMILINKADLLSETAQAELIERLAPYQQSSYQVIFSSVKKEGGLLALQNALSHKNAVFVGPSGVGKSSIISNLIHSDNIKIGEVSARGAGKHTTTATRLYQLPTGGAVIDSPGVREFNLWPVPLKDVTLGFKEFEPYVSGCKFRDCLHVSEPHCAVQSAVAAGKISPQRYAMYQTLIKEMQKQHDRSK